MNKVYYGDNLNFLHNLAQPVDLIYIDPPFNTGNTQKLRSQKLGKAVSEMEYDDAHDNYLRWLTDRLIAAAYVLKSTGSILVHLDWHEVHYVKVIMDGIFGKENFRNEIIWAYDYGARQKDKYPTKHDNILYYTKSKDFTFNYDMMERTPYLAPGLVGKEKAERGKTLTDVIWCTIVPTQGKERTGYPTQKPIKLLKNMIEVTSNAGDTVLDFFAGSGTIGEVCLMTDRKFILIDNNIQAIEVMKKRFEGKEVQFVS